MVETFSLNYLATAAVLNMLNTVLWSTSSGGILVMAIHPGWVKTGMGGPLMSNGGGEKMTWTEDSAKVMLNVMSTLTEKHNGSLLDWEGNGIPW
uniref:C-factor n=1 Tax=Oncorhynchus mykiss TaxID=8022 RepID=A0A8C7QE09_ONCMY